MKRFKAGLIAFVEDAVLGAFILSGLWPLMALLLLAWLVEK